MGRKGNLVPVPDWGISGADFDARLINDCPDMNIYFSCSVRNE